MNIEKASAGRPSVIGSEMGSPETEEADPSAPEVKSRYRTAALATVTALLVGLCIGLAVPFLPAITWGVALAIIAWPLHRVVCWVVKNKNFAAAFTTLAVVFLIIGPAVFVSLRLAREAASVAGRLRQETSDESTSWRDQLAGVPGVRHLLEWADHFNVDVEAQVREAVANYTQVLANLAHGSATVVLQFLVTVFILYYLFRDRGEFTDGLRNLLPLSAEEGTRVMRRAADSVHANLYATMTTSLIDATTGGIVFTLVGLPAPFLWAVVMFILGLLPILGAGIVWAPAMLFLLLSGKWVAGLTVLAWGLTVFVLVDNLLYARLAGSRMRMHAVPALISFLGGMAVFGMSGMVLGPAIFAVTMAFLEVWRKPQSTADQTNSPPR